MKLNMKKVVKFTGVVCAATGVVVLSAVVASSAAVVAVKEGFKAAKETMKRVMKEQKQAKLFDDEALEHEAAAEPAPAGERVEAEASIAN